MSGNVKSFSLHKAEKTGTATAESVIEHLYAAMQAGRVKDIVFAAIDEEGNNLVHGYNEMNRFRAIGMLEGAKQLVIDDMGKGEQHD